MPAESRRTPARGTRPHGRSGPGRTPSSRTTRVPATPVAGAAASPTGPAVTGRGPVGRGPQGRGPSGPAGPRRRIRLTGRSLILMLVVSVLAISYASSLKAYLQQRDQIGDLKEQIALREARIDDLQREKRRWEDPAFVRQQARALNYVMPGETAYVVLDEDGEPLDRQTSLTDPDTIAVEEPTAWWSTAWSSVELAGNPPEDDAREPATRIKDRRD